MTTLPSVAPRSVEPFLPLFHHKVQCGVTAAFSDTLCLLIGGVGPFMFKSSLLGHNSLFPLVFVVALSPGCSISPSSLHAVFSWCFMTCLVPLSLTFVHLLQAFFPTLLKTTRGTRIFKTHLKRIKWTSVGNRILLSVSLYTYLLLPRSQLSSELRSRPFL